VLVLVRPRRLWYPPTMAVTVYQYPKCSTCRRALKWLDAAGVEYRSVDLVATPIPAKQLTDLHARSGLPIARFFNTSGESYRSGDWKTRLPGMPLAAALKELAKDGKLVKRPIVDTGKQVLVGFDEPAYATTFTRK
jgi:arsenate reductase